MSYGKCSSASLWNAGGAAAFSGMLPGMLDTAL